MTSVMKKFEKTYREYDGQPSVFLLTTYHLDDPSYRAIIRVALTESEAQEWFLNAYLPGQGKKIQRICLYKQGEFNES